MLTEVLFCAGENQLNLFLQSPHIVSGTLCFQFCYSVGGASLTWTSQSANLIYVLISAYKLLTNLFCTFCEITAALRNWISLVKVSYQGNFHGRFLTIIFATFSKSGSQIVFTCISCSLPWWRPHRKHFVHKKTAKSALDLQLPFCHWKAINFASLC